MKLKYKIETPDGFAAEGEAAGQVIRIGRDSKLEIPFNEALFPKVSALHAELQMRANFLIVVPLSQSNRTLLNDEEVKSQARVNVGDRLQLGYTGPIIHILGFASDKPKSAPPPVAAPPVESNKTVNATAEQLAELRRTMSKSLRFEVGDGGPIGRDGELRFRLDHPLVSRRHAELFLRDGNPAIRDLSSANGTYLNGKLLAGPAFLKKGDRISIGPFDLSYDGVYLTTLSRSNNIELIAHRVRRTIIDRDTKQPLNILSDIQLAVRPGEFVCLIGPSGSGKTTLLSVLSGRARPDGGRVEINGADLHSHFDLLKGDIALVPQKDLLHDALTVKRGLGYTAELRLPPDTTEIERLENVQKMIETVGLEERAGTLIRELSGGQLKRASLANELLCRPSLLFLDEVTSGLDEQTDHDIMGLFRKIAEQDKTIVCITHNLANVEAFAHLVVVLTAGGHLAFIGSPSEAKKYFGDVPRLGEIYGVLSTRPAAVWQAEFQKSPYHERYVRSRLKPSAEDQSAPPVSPKQSGSATRAILQQTSTLLRRYMAIWKTNRLALLLLMGQCVLMAVLLSIVFQGTKGPFNTRNLLFLMNVACFWLGCSNAAKEVVKERVIYGRERAYNLRADSYLLSKLLVLASIGALQVLILACIVNVICRPEVAFGAQLAVLAISAFVGTSLGLLISAAAKSEEVAIALVPIMVIPQIILAGVIITLSGLGKLLAQLFVTCYWTQQILDDALPGGQKALIFSGGQPAESLALSLLAATIHALVFIILAYICLKRKP